MRRLPVFAALFLALVAAAACSPSEPLQVSTVQLGRSLNSDDTVGGHTTRFKPDDTIYVSVLSGQPGRGVVAVRWVYGGQVVSETSKEVSYNRESATEFHLQNSGGFPPGDYRVEILVDGEPVAQRQFRVEG